MQPTDRIIIEELKRRLAGGEADVPLLESFIARGLSMDVCKEYLAVAKQESSSIFETREVPKPIEVPVPGTQCGMNRLQFDDQTAYVTFMNDDRSVVVLDDFLNASEYNYLIAKAEAHLHPSTTVDESTGASQSHDSRKSSGMGFAHGECEIIQTIEKRIAEWTLWPIENGENIQALRYQSGEEYKPHYDHFDKRAGGYESLVALGGQRVATVIIYLSDVAAGGATHLVDKKLRFYPKKGRALFFSYDANKGGQEGLHAGEPVIEGEKWIITRWLRQSAVRQL